MIITMKHGQKAEIELRAYGNIVVVETTDYTQRETTRARIELLKEEAAALGRMLQVASDAVDR